MPRKAKGKIAVDRVTLAVIGLRAAGLTLLLSGQTKGSEQLYALADLTEAGKATDEHMNLIAEKLKTRPVDDADWDDVMQRIEQDSAKLQQS
jgi:hypothetical protein